MEQETIQKSDVRVDYDVVSEIAGHQQNTGVELIAAAKDIFHKVKEKGMQLAVKGTFKTFQTIEELERILTSAVVDGFGLKVYDEIYGG